MAELLLELFSEEIPARMQAAAGDELVRLITKTCAPLGIRNAQSFTGPRRIALVAEAETEVPAETIRERGPRESAPEQALAGFTRKHGVTKDDLILENGFWVLTKETPAVSAEAFLAERLPALLRQFPWPKSMRWGQGSSFTWVRPLRRILCTLNGTVVPFSLATDEGGTPDNGHNLHSSDLTEGHRFFPAGNTTAEPFTARTFAEWKDGLRARRVLADAAERRETITKGLNSLAQEEGLSIVTDPGLTEEVAGLVEWPVPLLGRIDETFMELPAEVMQVSMRVNQRYFALRHSDGTPAPRFAFVANIEPSDGGAQVIAGNERVLRARFADARHFWDLDRRQSLEARVPALENVTFHADLGSQGDRVRRLVRLAGIIAPMIGANPSHASRAALLSKSDLLTGMVGEFPELQGIMGGYYARHDNEPAEICVAISEQYSPRGPSDTTPEAPVSVALALADRFDMLTGFFAAGARPTGSGDPYGLRRAALGIISLIRTNSLRLDLVALFLRAAEALPEPLRNAPDIDLLPGFIAERLRVQLRSEGKRYDVLAAVSSGNNDTDITRLLARTDALAAMLATEDGKNLLAATKRAANILRIEDKKDGPHEGTPDGTLYTQPEETALASQLTTVIPQVETAIREERFTDAMRDAASLRPALDTFFEGVIVNADDPQIRSNRLKLLSELVRMTRLIADFSQIDG